MAAPRARAHRGGRVSAERALTFGSVAEDYEATRPGWPREAFAIAFEQFDLPGLTGPTPSTSQRGPASSRARSSSSPARSSPSSRTQALRAVLRRELPAVTVLEGTAESLPLASRRVPTPRAPGQAFHWFDVDRALDEISGTCGVPRGVAIAAWNTPPEEGTWYDAVVDFLDVGEPRPPAGREHATGRRRLRRTRAYGGLARDRRAARAAASSRAAFQRLLGTHSIINVLPPERRARLIEEAMAVADAQNAFDDDGSGAIPWRCELYVLRRRD